MWEPSINVITDPFDGETVIEINQGPFGLSMTVEQATKLAAELANAVFEQERKAFAEILREMSPLPEPSDFDDSRFPVIPWREDRPRLRLIQGGKQ